MWGSAVSLLLSCLYYLVLSLIFGGLLAFLLYCCYIKYIHMKYDHIPGAPRDSFLFGHLPSITKSMENNKLVHDLLLRWAEEYGPVVRMNVLHGVSLYSTCPESVKEFLMSPNYPKDPNVYKRLFYLFGKRFMGKGLLTDDDHEHWYRQRRIMNPAFSHTYLMQMVEVFNDIAEQMMVELEKKADGKQQVNMHATINCVTLDVITRVAFGLELGLTEGMNSVFPAAISTILKGMVKYLQNPLMQYMPQHWAFIKEVQKSTELLRKTASESIMQRKEAMLRGEELPRDILTKILQVAQEDGGMDDEMMRDNFITFFIAGQETTANQLSFTVMELTRQPEITQKLQKEIDEVIGVKRDINFEDISNLTYITQVLKESLRLYPPGPGTSRYIEKDTEIAGVRIPGGVAVTFNTYVMGRMEKFFPDPYKFDPERFNPSAEKPYYCYFPFALGPRSCLGQVFSQLEAKVVLSKLLQRFNFQLVPGQSYEIMDTGTLRPRDGVVCTLTPRNQ